jgi:hypothetical protein
MVTVTVYSKPGCHLCEVAHEALLRVQADQPFELVEIDILSDPALGICYGDRIPVILLDGRVLFDYEVNEARLREKLKEVNEAL